MLAVGDVDGGDALRLVPIDHGFALPTNLEEVFFDWLHWPQLKKPVDPAVRDAVLSIDCAADVQVLRLLGLPEQAVHLQQVATLWLQEGIKSGATLYDIARGMCRDGDLSQPSALERLLADEHSLAPACSPVPQERIAAMIAQHFAHA